jgi:hypothetical protein
MLIGLTPEPIQLTQLQETSEIASIETSDRAHIPSAWRADRSRANPRTERPALIDPSIIRGASIIQSERRLSERI